MALCTCEDCARSVFGTIGDEETVGRLIFNPDHILKTDSSIRPGAFPLTHIRYKGLSLVRTDKISAGELKIFAEAVANLQPSRTWHGVLTFPGHTVRQLRTPEEKRLVCLFEDPTPAENGVPENQAHALTIAAEDGMTEHDAREVRAAIMTGQFQSAA